MHKYYSWFQVVWLGGIEYLNLYVGASEIEDWTKPFEL